MVSGAQRYEEGERGDESGDGGVAEEGLALFADEQVGDEDDEGERRDEDGGRDARPRRWW